MPSQETRAEASTKKSNQEPRLTAGLFCGLIAADFSLKQLPEFKYNGTGSFMI